MSKQSEAVLSDYRIFETDEFLKQFKKLPEQNFSFLQKKLYNYVYPLLKNNPFLGTNIKKLRGYLPETWRYRIGKFRLFYNIDKKEKIVFILTIDFRKNAYR